MRYSTFSPKSLLALSLALCVAFGVHARKVTIELKEFRIPCSMYPQKGCLLAQIDQLGSWQPFPYNIQGFKYKEGNSYLLEVEEYHKGNEEMPYYKLIRVQNKTWIGKRSKADMDKDVAQASLLSKHNWKLIQIDGKHPAYDKAYLKFETNDQRFNGYAGCNRFFGGYFIHGDRLIFSGVGSTMKGCLDQDIDQLENRMVGYLQSKSLRYDIAEQTLNIYDGDKLAMIFGIDFSTKTIERAPDR